jgi:WD40 repeat protein
MGTFTAPNVQEGISCVTLSPDREVVCAAQQDETLKFWRVFDAQMQARRQQLLEKDVKKNSTFCEELR